jgi:hypothetical protein
MKTFPDINKHTQALKDPLTYPPPLLEMIDV